jgi:hypothetical protein
MKKLRETAFKKNQGSGVEDKWSMYAIKTENAVRKILLHTGAIET